jgi:uncharacterized small protein (DUF1192 family)
LTKELIARKSETCPSVQPELEKVQREKNALERMVNTLTTDIEARQKEIGRLTEELLLKNKSKSTESGDTLNINKIDKLQEQLRDLLAKHEEKLKELQAEKEKNLGLDKQLEKLRDDALRKEKEITSQMEKIVESKTTDSTKDASKELEIKNLQKRLENIVNDFNAEKKELMLLNPNKKRVAELDTQIASLQKEIQTLKDKVRDLEVAKGISLKRISSLESSETEKLKQIANLNKHQIMEHNLSIHLHFASIIEELLYLWSILPTF